MELYPPTLHDSRNDTLAAVTMAGGGLGGLMMAATPIGPIGLGVGAAGVLAGLGLAALPWCRLPLRQASVRRRVRR